MSALNDRSQRVQHIPHRFTVLERFHGSFLDARTSLRGEVLKVKFCDFSWFCPCWSDFACGKTAQTCGNHSCVIITYYACTLTMFTRIFADFRRVFGWFVYYYRILGRPCEAIFEMLYLSDANSSDNEWMPYMNVRNAQNTLWTGLPRLNASKGSFVHTRISLRGEVLKVKFCDFSWFCPCWSDFACSKAAQICGNHSEAIITYFARTLTRFTPIFADFRRVFGWFVYYYRILQIVLTTNECPKWTFTTDRTHCARFYHA